MYTKTLKISLFTMLFGLIMIMVSCSTERKFDNVDDMVEDSRKHITELGVDGLKAKYDEGEMYLLIDVREPDEYYHGYIPTALNIPAGLLVFKIGNEQFWDDAMLYMPEKDEEIIIYCKKGKRGVLAVESLQKLGYTNVKNLEGGWKNWEMNYPLEYEKSLDQLHGAPVEEEGGC